MTTNHVDSWFALDILLGAYKLLIILDLHINNYHHDRLSSTSVDLARRSLELFRTFMGSSSHAHWGTRYVATVFVCYSIRKQALTMLISLTLLHQFTPFVILSTHVIQSLEANADLELVGWMRSVLERTAQERVKLRPVVYTMIAMALACEKATISTVDNR